jgi:hypothetical protein
MKFLKSPSIAWLCWLVTVLIINNRMGKLRDEIVDLKFEVYQINNQQEDYRSTNTVMWPQDATDTCKLIKAYEEKIFVIPPPLVHWYLNSNK